MSRARPPVESYVVLVEVGRTASGKSKLFEVRTRDGTETLASVKWYGPWRCYAMFPFAGMLFEKRCLRDIADMLERESRAQLSRAKERAGGGNAQ